MKILLISQFFYPETAPDVRGLPLAKRLIREGHSVEVLTGFPNYPYGKLYKNYKMKFFQRETAGGVKIIRVPLYPSHNGSAAKRILNYLSFAVSASVIGIFLVKKPDIIIGVCGPATLMIPAILMKFTRRAPAVLDVQDLWPDSLASTGMITNRFLIGINKALCKTAYRLFDRILVLSPGLKSKLIERGVNPGKILVLYNWSNDFEVPETADPELKRRLGFDLKFTVLFAGNLGKAQALESLIYAFEILQRENSNTQMAFIGDGVELSNLKKLAISKSLGNIIFIPRVSSSEIGSVLKCADLLIVHLKKDPLFEITVPSKTQAYIKAGVPVLMCVPGDSSRLIEISGCGISAEPENPRDISRKIKFMAGLPKERLQEMGLMGISYYRHNLSMEVGCKKMINLFNDTILKTNKVRQGDDSILTSQNRRQNN